MAELTALEQLQTGDGCCRAHRGSFMKRILLMNCLMLMIGLSAGAQNNDLPPPPPSGQGGPADSVAASPGAVASRASGLLVGGSLPCCLRTFVRMDTISSTTRWGFISEECHPS